MNALSFLLLMLYGAIALYEPQTRSLREIQKTSIPKRLFRCKGTLLLGTILIAIALLTFDPINHITLLPQYGLTFGYSHQAFFEQQLYFQPFTAMFMHSNLMHLASNISALLLLSAYERRVGILRYLSVFILSGIFSGCVDIFYLPQDTISLGASGGISGLLAAYILDREAKSTLQWVYNSILVIAFVLLLSFFQDNELQDSVNWLAHVFGAMFAAVYVKFLNPLTTPSVETA